MVPLGQLLAGGRCSLCRCGGRPRVLHWHERRDLADFRKGNGRVRTKIITDCKSNFNDECPRQTYPANGTIVTR
eukprot:343901-Amphidinium_carterae.1